jgi:hypothetical protein
MNNFIYEKDFLYALLTTISIESIIMFFLLYFFNFNKLNIKNIFFLGILPSFATLPYLWFIFPIFFIGKPILYIFFGELFVLIMEGLIIKGILDISLSKALFYSLITNIISFLGK